jgi:Tol biopolymer transport system component/C-terminal processing protease CtpA/Prc
MKHFSALFALLFCSFFSAFSEPLWLRYPAVSPDGEKIAFTYRGDIFVVKSSGGDAVALTAHDSHDLRPVWSSDGKMIAFASNRYGGYDVFVVSAEGGEAQRITFHSGAEFPAAFSADNKEVYFEGRAEDLAENLQFPVGGFSELYAVSVSGGRPKMLMPNVALFADVSKDGSKILYHDWKGYEDNWRKRHRSSVTRDVWMFDVKAKKNTQLTAFEGEDRHPAFTAEQNGFYFLTEQFGSFNVAEASFANPKEVKQITFHEKHPVRFLSVADNGTICYAFHGEIYLKKSGPTQPQKVNITVKNDNPENDIANLTLTSGATEFEVSPSGKEVVFVVRGEVFVTSVEFGTTKRITDTPEQERSVSFSPDGKAILYASERGNSWKLYQSKIVREQEKYFFNATILKEEVVLETDKESFQPAFSPDGTEVAFLEERTTLKVINLKNKQVRTILDGKFNYSYNDGDQWYQWSPDGKWFLLNFLSPGRWSSEVGLVDAEGKQNLQNLSFSGYEDFTPKFMQKGKSLIWISDRYGFRSHGSWGAHLDIVAGFFTQDAFNQFTMNKEEYELTKENEKKDGEKKADEKVKDDKNKAAGDTTKKTEKVEPFLFERDGFENRQIRLTVNSSALSDAYLSNDGLKLFYMTKFEGGYDLWVHDIKEHQSSLLVKLNGTPSGIVADKEGKNLFVMSNSNLIRIDVDKKEQKSISFAAKMEFRPEKEREYFFEHTWRQVKKKFYDPALHGIDWDFYKKSYARFLPHINNPTDFAEMLAEMLGELNASHTGASYRNIDPNLQHTARLGVFYDQEYDGVGLKISEILEKSPLMKAEKSVKQGMIIEKINGILLDKNISPYQILNGKVGTKILLSIKNGNESFEVSVKPISQGEESELLYARWVKKMRDLTEKISGGKIGYAHVRGMDEESFRQVFSEIMGSRNTEKEGIIIDSRFNGGGWLHDDLATLLSGKRYIDFAPRGQYIGSDPQNKWTKKSAVLISESNYSDAHGFPVAYRAHNIGKTVGMPVPGTMTAVWWEFLHDGKTRFGIPQVGVRDMQGRYQENLQFEPDVKVSQSIEKITKGEDEQLQKAVEVLLKEK